MSCWCQLVPRQSSYHSQHMGKLCPGLSSNSHGIQRKRLESRQCHASGSGCWREPGEGCISQRATTYTWFNNNIKSTTYSMVTQLKFRHYLLGKQNKNTDDSCCTQRFIQIFVQSKLYTGEYRQMVIPILQVHLKIRISWKSSFFS